MINHLRVIAQEEAFQRAHLALTSSTELLRSSRNGNDKSRSSVEQSTINTFYSTKLNSLTSFLLNFYLPMFVVYSILYNALPNKIIEFFKVLCFTRANIELHIDLCSFLLLKY